jgi:predicted membrane chloride channel (bestrophin family)
MPFLDEAEFNRIVENQKIWQQQYKQKQSLLRKIRNILQKRYISNAHLSKEQIAQELREKLRLCDDDIAAILNKFNVI